MGQENTAALVSGSPCGRRRQKAPTLDKDFLLTGPFLDIPALENLAIYSTPVLIFAACSSTLLPAIGESSGELGLLYLTDIGVKKSHGGFSCAPHIPDTAHNLIPAITKIRQH